jgi:hypothetical protein
MLRAVLFAANIYLDMPWRFLKNTVDVAIGKPFAVAFPVLKSHGAFLPANGASPVL